MDISRREKHLINSHRSSFAYFSFGGREIEVDENSECVDGIGGVIWEGAIIMCRFLEHVFIHSVGKRFHLLELGCGAGLCGLTSAAALEGHWESATISLTDRHIDLCCQNLSNTGLFRDVHVSCFELTWGACNSDGTVSKILSSLGPADVLIGAEIACLRLQQDALLETVQLLCHPTSVIFLTFDDKPPPNDSKYEAEMNEKFRRMGFCREVVFTAAVSWKKVFERRSPRDDDSAIRSAFTVARLEDFTARFSRCAAVAPLQTVMHDPSDGGKHGDRGREEEKRERGEEKYASNPPAPPLALAGLPPPPPPGFLPPPPPVASSSGPAAAPLLHHVTAFFRPEAVRTCQRCHHRFFVQPALHPSDSCRFHSGFYVCRRHPAETKCSVDGRGDNLGYYGTGKEGWAAEFWDCCGSEDPLAPGCCSDLHSPYS